MMKKVLTLFFFVLSFSLFGMYGAYQLSPPGSPQRDGHRDRGTKRALSGNGAAFENLKRARTDGESFSPGRPPLFPSAAVLAPSQAVIDARKSLEKFLTLLGAKDKFAEISPQIKDIDGAIPQITNLDEIFKKHIRNGFLNGDLSIPVTDRLLTFKIADSDGTGAAAEPVEAKSDIEVSGGSLGGSPARPPRTIVPQTTPSTQRIALLELGPLLHRLIGSILLAPVGSIDEELRQFVAASFLIDPRTFKISTRPHSPSSDPVVTYPILTNLITAYHTHMQDAVSGLSSFVTSIDKNAFIEEIDKHDLVTWLHFEPGNIERLAAHIRHLIFNLHCYRSALPDPYLANQTDIFYRDAIRLYKNIEAYIETALTELRSEGLLEARGTLLRNTLTRAYERILDFKHLMVISEKVEERAVAGAVSDVEVVSFAYKKLLILAKAIEISLGIVAKADYPSLNFDNMVFVKDAHGYQVTIEKGSQSSASGGHFGLPGLDKTSFPVYKALDLCELPSVMATLSEKHLTVKAFKELYKQESTGIILGDWIIHDKEKGADEDPKSSNLFPECYRENYLNYVGILNRAINDSGFAASENIIVYTKQQKRKLGDPEYGLLMTCTHKKNDVFLIKHRHNLSCKSELSQAAEKPCAYHESFMYVTVFRHVDEYTINLGGAAAPFRVTTIHSVFPMVIFEKDEVMADRFTINMLVNAKEVAMNAINAEIERVEAPLPGESPKKRNAAKALSPTRFTREEWAAKRKEDIPLIEAQKKYEELVARRKQAIENAKAEKKRIEDLPFTYEPLEIMAAEIRAKLASPRGDFYDGRSGNCRLIEIAPHVFVRVLLL